MKIMDFYISKENRCPYGREFTFVVRSNILVDDIVVSRGKSSLALELLLQVVSKQKEKEDFLHEACLYINIGILKKDKEYPKWSGHVISSRLCKVLMKWHDHYLRSLDYISKGTSILEQHICDHYALFAQTLDQLAIALSSLKRHDEASEKWTKAMELADSTSKLKIAIHFANHRITWSVRVYRFDIKRGHFETASSLLESVLHSPKSWNRDITLVTFHLACCYRSLGNFEEAELLFRRCLRRGCFDKEVEVLCQLSSIHLTLLSTSKVCSLQCRS